MLAHKIIYCFVMVGILAVSLKIDRHMDEEDHQEKTRVIASRGW